MKKRKCLRAFIGILGKKSLGMMPENTLGDKLYAVITFIIHHKRLPSKKLIFNDVLHQMKMTGELGSPLHTFTSDKELGKQYVKSVVGEQFTVPTLAVLKSPEEVDQYDFPAVCCIKPTHASGKVILRKANEPIDLAEIKRWFSLNYYLAHRETNYKNLTPKVIVEPILFTADSLREYKVFCYKGKPGYILYYIPGDAVNRQKSYDIHWNELPCYLVKSRCLD